MDLVASIERWKRSEHHGQPEPVWLPPTRRSSSSHRTHRYHHVDDRHVFDVGDGEQRHHGVFSVTGLFLHRRDNMPVAAAPRRDIDRRRLYTGLVQDPPRRCFIDRCAHPDILPGHMQRIVDRIFAMHDRFDANVGIEIDPAPMRRLNSQNGPSG